MHVQFRLFKEKIRLSDAGKKPVSICINLNLHYVIRQFFKSKPMEVFKWHKYK